MTTLEKIRAEILFKNRYQFWEYGIDTYLKIDDVLAVLDKYAEQEPCTDAQERYEDLCEYFGDAKDVLKSRKDFKAWLDRIKWHIHKAEELAAENDDLRDQLAMRDRFKQGPCDDVVSRQAVLDVCKHKGKDCIRCSFYNIKFIDERTVKGYCTLGKAVRELPPVRPQEQTGHWIRQDNTKEPLYGWYFCSECNSVIGEKTKFCSNCGAKM